MTTQKQREYTEWVIATVRDANPYRGEPGGRAWAIGFLAANLADILSEDPILRGRYARRVEHVTSTNKSSNSR